MAFYILINISNFSFKWLLFVILHEFESILYIMTFNQVIYNFLNETKEVINEAKQILDVEDVISSILLVDDLRIQKN